ncbi:MAG: DUF1592 domain-containing protein [Proteobacteria bacterium]|nr:MAG: DUF1592 domain-containing protein [Pseudomonadota bacterium]
MRILVCLTLIAALGCGKAEKRVTSKGTGSGASQDADAPSTGKSGDSGSGTGGGGKSDSPSAPEALISSNAIINADAKCVPEVVQPPLQRLTVLQYRNAVQDLLALTTKPQIILPSDDLVGPFAINTLTLASQVSVSQYESAGEAISALAKPQIAAILKCEGNSSEVCLKTFVDTFGARALRRPLNDEEKTRYLALATPVLTKSGINEAALVLIRAFLTSPNFLYHIEVGDAGVLTAYELAARLAFSLWDSVPDAELTKAAADGKILTEDGLKAQVSRLIASPRFVEKSGRFVSDWLGLGKTASITKDKESFPQFTPAIAQALQKESTEFASHVFGKGDGKLSSLLAADYTFLSEPLFAYYNITKPANWKEGTAVSLKGSGRAGLLTQGAFLTSHSHPTSTAPVSRGKVVFENVLCLTVPPPPPGLPALPESSPGVVTARQRFEVHEKSPACAGCHKVIDPLGLAMENFDASGVWREMDGGEPIVAGGTLTLPEVGKDVKFQDAAEMVSTIVSSPDAQVCAITQAYRFIAERPVLSKDSCLLSKYYKRFQASGTDMRALVSDIVLSPEFRKLRGTP